MAAVMGDLTGATLLRQGRWPDDEPQEGPRSQRKRYISEAGHRLQRLAASWSEIAPENRLGAIGVYQTLGREKLSVGQPVIDTVLAKGFDALLPASLVLRYSPFGAAASLAVAMRCEGPFFTLEADALSGCMATLQALTDLRRDRCQLALVCSGVGERAWLTLLGGCHEGHRLGWHVRFPSGSREPPGEDLEAMRRELGAEPVVFPVLEGGDPHGMGAVQDALTRAWQGTPSAVWGVTEDRRGVLLAFGVAEVL